MEPGWELFDLCDPDGRPLGVTKPRPLVHRDGDWHRAFHCWVVSRDEKGAPAVVLQRRSSAKATWPGLWDVSVGGHYSAGEGLEGGLREIREELGLIVDLEQLVRAARRREVVFYESGLVEREIQDVFFLLRDVEVEALRPDPSEVIAVAIVPTNSLVRLARARIQVVTVPGGRVDPYGMLPTEETIQASDLVPRAGNYYGKVARLAARLARGGRRVRTRWW